MIYRNKLAVFTMAAFGLFAVNAASAAGFYNLASNHDVELCVAEVKDNADYSGAGRVRHEIESTKRRSVGYSLKIATTVYGEADGQAIREYAAVCVVSGGKKPIEFTIREKDDAA